MAERGIGSIRELVKRAEARDLALDGHMLDGRMKTTSYPLGYLNDFAAVLELDLDERLRLAVAYTFEIQVPSR